MTLAEAFSEPRALCLDARMRLLRADDAAKMLAVDILGRDIDKPARHSALQKQAGADIKRLHRLYTNQ